MLNLRLMSRTDFYRAAATAVLYGLFGWLGLRLAVPPGYATLIWPASGIAVSALLFYGHRLWPGVFLGAFAVNAVIGNAFGAQGPDWSALGVAACIATGSTVQSLLAVQLLRRRFGMPVALDGMRDFIPFILRAALLPCLIGASVGVASLMGAGITEGSAALSNWITWWIGDVAGILLVLPLAMISPLRPWSARYRGRPLARVSRLGLVALLVPLGLTFYAWKFTNEAAFEQGLTSFKALAGDSEQALLHRLDAYKQALDAGAGLFSGSSYVSQTEWRAFVSEFGLEANLPGINGVGFIEPVMPDELQRFLIEHTTPGETNLTIKPAPSTDREMFVITFIEPLATNAKAFGLDIAFEQNRRTAAVHARDTGRATITGRIFLVQDETKSAGFLLLRPLYEASAPLETMAQRRDAFRGWVYAPFIAPRFMDSLTASQGTRLNLSVYDGGTADPDQLIYSSSEGNAHNPAFQVSKVLSVMEKTWTVVWESTPAFEATAASKEPAIVLAAGLALSLLFGVLLLSYARREEAIQQTVELKTREIAAREQQNRSIVDTALAGVIVLDEGGIIRSVNPATELIFGYRADELDGQTIATLFPGSKEDAASAQKQGEVSRLVETRNRNGEELFLTLQKNEWRTEAGDLRHTLIISDVTLQQKVARELAISEQRLQQAIEAAAIGVFDIDLKTGRSVVSGRWRAMLGFGEDEDIDPQEEWRRRVHPDDRAAVEKADAACIEGRAARSLTEYRIRHRDGRWIWLRSEAIGIERDKTGRAMRMIGTQTDITHLKETELALRESEERFRLALENAPVGMALISDDGRWMQVNETLCTLLQYEPEEFEHLDFASVIHPDDRPASGQLRKMLDGVAAAQQAERRFVAKNGRSIWCLFGLSRVEDHQTRHGYFVAQFQDIDARKEAERAKSEFIATVSHELRTPLTSIRGSLGLVLGSAEGQLDPKISHLLTIALKNCERLVELVNDILDLEKIASGAMQFDRRVEDLNELVRQSVEANQAYFEKFDVTPVVHADGLYAVEVDARRLQQVFSNLLSNAAKFSPSGGTVEVSIAKSGETVRISVADEGAGVPPEFEGKIFNRFSQADSSATRQQGGTGLGLHISRQIIEQMNGSISYRNRPDSGAEFTVALPLSTGAAEKAMDRTTVDANGEAGAEAPQSGSNLPRALHVEEDADFFAILSALLKESLELSRASTVAEARQQLAEQHFDLLIVEEALPDGSGLDLLDEVSRRCPDLPVVMVGSRDMPEVDERSVRVIVKSRLKEEELAQIVSEAANRRRARRAAL
ncbi:PAS domain S-box protein [Afifella sp. JA880]|uniref:PAS domain S-box protein n=1 Tax=Afifella sp. JA880 TaxID=2975280 RepID=UPI0028E09F62|nr:PAS domain S-box protein [Afifella sp. JA880]